MRMIFLRLCFFAAFFIPIAAHAANFNALLARDSITTTPGARADVAAAASEKSDGAPPHTDDRPRFFAMPDDRPQFGQSLMSRISVNTISPLDMNWTASMDLNATTADVPTSYDVILPFFEDYPIENLEVKLQLLNIRF